MPVPFVSTVTPLTGAAGTYVQIIGTSLNVGGVIVKFNGVLASATYQSSTKIICIAPVGGSTGPVVVSNPSGAASYQPTFTYTSGGTPTITSLTPTSGPIGSQVTIAGTGFGPSQGANYVTFNGVRASVITWASAGTSILVVVPATATTGPVIVTVAGVASNSETYTVTNVSNGGTAAPLGLFLIPAYSPILGPNFYTFDPTNFNDANSDSSYSWKVEPGIAGRPLNVRRVIVLYRDLGVATGIQWALTALSGQSDPNNADTPVTNAVTVTMGTSAASGKICALVLGLTQTGCNMQLSMYRPAGAGPVSITNVRIEGGVDPQPL